MAAESPFRFGNGEHAARRNQKYEKLEREQREREQMRQAVAAYASPIIKCPPFRTNQPERQAPRPTALAATEC